MLVATASAATVVVPSRVHIMNPMPAAPAIFLVAFLPALVLYSMMSTMFITTAVFFPVHDYSSFTISL
jgi:hypothetical protein